MDHSVTAPHEGELPHSSPAGPPEGPDAQGHDDVQRRWEDSPEYASTRRVRYICVGLAAVVALVALGLLGLKQVELSRQINSSEQTVVDTSNAIDSWNSQIQDLKAEVTSDQDELADSAGSIAASPDYSTSLTADISATESQISADQKLLLSTENQLSQADQNHTDALTRLDDMTGFWIAGCAALLAWFVLLSLAYRLLQRERRDAYENARLLASLGTPETKDDPFDLQTLWRANREQLKTYHQLVLNYASSTRQTTIITLAVGFTFLLVIAGVATLSTSIPAAIAASVVAAAGTALTGFIANAVLRNADTSSNEVLSFFAHPLEVERVLTAERIISKMPASAHDSAKLLIIQSLTSQTQVKDGDSGGAPAKPEGDHPESA